MKKMNFVRTTDEETANRLLELGFQLIEKDSTSWTFLNSTVAHFDEDSKKVVYTNILHT